MDVQKEIQKCVTWLAVEHSYFQELNENLEKLKEAINLAKEETGVGKIKKTMKSFLSLSRAETRVNRYVKNVRDILREFENSVITADALKEIELRNEITAQEIEQLRHQLEIEAASLVRDASRYEGKIIDLLRHLKENVKKHEFEQAQQIIMQVEETIEDAERWVAALITDLDKAKSLSEEYSGSIEQIEADIIHNLPSHNPSDRILYLTSLCENKRLHEKKVVDVISSLINRALYDFIRNIHLKFRDYLRGHYIPKFIGFSINWPDESKSYLQEVIIKTFLNPIDSKEIQPSKLYKDFEWYLASSLLSAAKKYKDIKDFKFATYCYESLIRIRLRFYRTPSTGLYYHDYYIKSDEVILPLKELYEVQGELNKLGELTFLDRKKGSEAAEIFERAGNWKRASEVWSKLGNDDRALLALKKIKKKKRSA